MVRVIAKTGGCFSCMLFMLGFYGIVRVYRGWYASVVLKGKFRALDYKMEGRN